MNLDNSLILNLFCKSKVVSSPLGTVSSMAWVLGWNRHGFLPVETSGYSDNTYAMIVPVYISCLVSSQPSPLGKSAEPPPLPRPAYYLLVL